MLQVAPEKQKHCNYAIMYIKKNTKVKFTKKKQKVKWKQNLMP